MDKRILLPLVILPAFQTGNMQAADQPAKRPNIILFMVDDMGWEDTSLPFWTEKTHYNEVYETPNMERLARQGVMFTQAYASSISSPSRCSLITGTNAATVSPTGRCKRIRRPTAKTVCSTYLTGTITASVRLREQTIPSSGLLSSSS